MGVVENTGGAASGCRPEEEFKSGLRGLVFDIDGVMFDSRSSNMEYYNIVRRAVLLPPLSKEEEDYCHMASVKESLQRIIPPDYREAAEAACRRINYREQILPLLSVEPGLLECLHWLQQWDVKLGIFTNRMTAVEELLRYFGLEVFFTDIMTAAICPPKPHPGGLLNILDIWECSPCEIAFLGDSKVDEAAAHSAGVPFWAFRNPALSARLHFNDFFTMISMITPLVEGGQSL